MPRDHLSPWHVRQLARRMVGRRLSLAASMRVSDTRDPEHGETPLSADEVAFGIQKGLILGPIDLRGLHAGTESLQSGVRELRRQDDPRHPGATDPAGEQGRTVQGGAQGLDRLRPRRGGAAPACEGERR